ncbi:MAG: ABC transporter ATP-binding protein [Patescibacteria group bacterium]
MLQFKNLEITIAGKKVLHDLNLNLEDNQHSLLVGPNGAGKTSIFKAILGKHGVSVTSGEIIWDGIVLNDLNVSERSGLGIGMMHQNPPKFNRLSLRDLYTVLKVDLNEFSEYIELLDLEELIDKPINNLSGGEVKRSELFQVLMQHPKLILLDEPESGVDPSHFQMLAKTLKHYLQKHSASILTITHTGGIMDYLEMDHGYILDAEQQLHGPIHPKKCLSKMQVW